MTGRQLNRIMYDFDNIYNLVEHELYKNKYKIDNRLINIMLSAYIQGFKGFCFQSDYLYGLSNITQQNLKKIIYINNFKIDVDYKIIHVFNKTIICFTSDTFVMIIKKYTNRYRSLKNIYMFLKNQ